ncbi:MAG: cell envelope integrity protein TolA [Proteobacteria bacterium]|nr:cell envelope integrity protein TolA [Pseudomonadota bacterium]MBU1739635.1 cell envelope integrity protein TolA [Pseudomonadota bacterium]
MRARLTALIDDLHYFLSDLRTFLNPRSAAAGLGDCWDDLRHDREQRTPFLLTVAVHAGAILFTIFGPLIIWSEPTIPEVYTVELYQAVEPPPEVQKVVIREKAPPPPPPVPEPAPAAKLPAVSLSPLKQKLALEKAEREKEKLRQELIKTRMEQVKLDFMKEQAEKEARKAANTAVSRISDLYRREKEYSEAQAITTPDAQTVPDAPPSDSRSRAREMEAIDRYKAQLVQHIDKFWKLPELKEWSDELECVMIIRVNRDGSVISSYFKKRSADSRFNQYVQKAVDDATPLPPFPIDLPQQNDEIHVTFYPGGLL